jgi:endonuclease YncB( thermonuclease family)
MPALVLLILLAVALSPGPAPASAVEQKLVREVIDGDTLVLEPAVDGLAQVRLVGIQAPKLPLGRSGLVAWPMAEEARQALADLALGRDVRLEVTGRSIDRHRRRLAHVVRDDGLWLQAEMLRRGLARVYTFDDNRARAAEMLAIERAARAARRGLWAHPFYGVRSPEVVTRDIDTFQIVEGRVVEARRVRDRVYVNFGADWRSDFTVSIAGDDLDTFGRDGVDPLAWGGRRLRVRGWVRSFNGPLIEATHPEQIEVLDDDGS